MQTDDDDSGIETKSLECQAKGVMVVLHAL